MVGLAKDLGKGLVLYPHHGSLGMQQPASLLPLTPIALCFLPKCYVLLHGGKPLEDGKGNCCTSQVQIYKEIQRLRGDSVVSDLWM